MELKRYFWSIVHYRHYRFRKTYSHL
jgi:hypothetical protein